MTGIGTPTYTKACDQLLTAAPEELVYSQDDDGITFKWDGGEVRVDIPEEFPTTWIGAFTRHEHKFHELKVLFATNVFPLLVNLRKFTYLVTYACDDTSAFANAPANLRVFESASFEIPCLEGVEAVRLISCADCCKWFTNAEDYPSGSPDVFGDIQCGECVMAAEYNSRGPACRVCATNVQQLRAECANCRNDLIWSACSNCGKDNTMRGAASRERCYSCHGSWNAGSRTKSAIRGKR